MRGEKKSMLQRSEASSGVHIPGMEPSHALDWRRRGWRMSRPVALVTGVGRDGGGVGAGEGPDLAWLLQHHRRCS
jgi:hypothetical protein